MSKSLMIGRRGFLKGTAAGAASLAAPTVFTKEAFAQAKEIPFAVIQPLTGPVAFAGIPGKNGAEMAVEAINSAGGIKSMGGAKLKMMTYDTESKPDIGKLRAERAVQDGVCAIVGSPQSAVGRVIVQVADQAKVSNIIDQGSGDFLTETGSRYVFRVMPSNRQQTISDLKYVQNVGQLTKQDPVKRIAMLYEDSAAGQEGVKTVENLASKYNLELIEQVGYPPSATDVTGFVTRLKRAKADFLMMYSWEADSILFLRTMLEQNYTPPGIIGKAFTDKVVAEAGPLSEALCSTAYFSHRIDPPGAPKGRNQKFHDDYVAYTKSPFSPLAALSYTSVTILANALERAGSADRETVRGALAATDMTGADGILQIVDRIKFDETGSSIYAQTLVDQIQNKEKRVVFPANVAEMPAIFPMPSFRSRG